nr:MAG TPA: hypothetical protein [Caudoviricetes sp.]
MGKVAYPVSIFSRIKVRTWFSSYGTIAYYNPLTCIFVRYNLSKPVQTNFTYGHSRLLRFRSKRLFCFMQLIHLSRPLFFCFFSE